MTAASETTGLVGGNERRIASRKAQLLAFAFSIIGCLCCGSVALFSIYIPTLQQELGYSLIQINVISISCMLGTYLIVPLLGYLGDRYGQSKLGLLGGILLPLAYFYSAYLVSSKGSYLLLAACFFTIGVGTSGLFFCGLLTCARVFPNSTGLSLSSPIASYGISSFLESQLVQTAFKDKSKLYLSSVFVMFGCLFAVSSALSYCGAKLCGHDGAPKVEKIIHHIQEDEYEPEQPLIVHTEPESVKADDIEIELLTQQERLMLFVSQKTMWILFCSFILTSGPLEMYVNNMGAIIDTISNDMDVSAQVSIFSLSSTAARLFIGILSDFLVKYISRPTLLSLVLLMAGISHVAMSKGVFTIHDGGSLFYVSSLINGFSYGSVFTLFPTIVACVWGINSIGTNWGLFILGPAIGSLIFGMVFGQVYESNNGEMVGHICSRGVDCYSSTFRWTATGLILSSVTVYGLWRLRWKNHVENL